MARNVASDMADLDEKDFHLLSGVEHGMRFSEWVSREKLPQFSRLTEEEVDYRLERMLDLEFLERKTIQYEGVQLTFAGYDVLALHAFAERDEIEGMGSPLGVGKESDVYEVQGFRPMALKFHREGYTQFREVHRGRDYTSEKEHTSWQYTARKAAEREFEALEGLYPDVNVPRPVAQNRHAIVMEKMDGVELQRAQLEPEQASGVLDLILRELATAYDLGYVHADVSEYNVFVDEDGVVLFDWPQATSTDHENARELLDRDVENIVEYFQQKYPGDVPDADLSSIAESVATGDFSSVANH
jgi:RIO kinase 2